jgi:hypothetical protein
MFILRLNFVWITQTRILPHRPTVALGRVGHCGSGRLQGPPLDKRFGVAIILLYQQQWWLSLDHLTADNNEKGSPTQKCIFGIDQSKRKEKKALGNILSRPSKIITICSDHVHPRVYAICVLTNRESVKRLALLVRKGFCDQLWSLNHLNLFGPESPRSNPTRRIIEYGRWFDSRFRLGL